MPDAKPMQEITKRMAKQQRDQHEPAGTAGLPSKSGADDAKQPPAAQMAQQRTSAPGGKV